MVNIINSWAKGLILAIIIVTIIEIILPEGSNKKYVKTIIGIYILFVMIHPLITSFTNKDIDISLLFQDATKKMNEYESRDLVVETNSYIEENYRSNLNRDINEKIKQKGFKIDFLKLDIETETEKIYGNINNITMKISKLEEKDTNENGLADDIQIVNNVEIKISDEPNINEGCEENISEDEIKTIKEFLSSEYGISTEKIFINE